MPADSDDRKEPLQAARMLWRRGDHAEARAVVSKALRLDETNPRLKLAAWAYDDVFLAPVMGRHVTLVRRSPSDLRFIHEAWADRPFMERFHRLAPSLPANDKDLSAILAKEAAATLLDAKALHWTIVSTAQQQRIGIASFTEISLPHRRAEFIVGVRGAAQGVALEASLLALEFAFRSIGLHKVHSTVYGTNLHALRSTRHLGFKPEGLLRKHIRDPQTREYIDLCLSGLFQQEFFSVANQRLAHRLLGRALAA